MRKEPALRPADDTRRTAGLGGSRLRLGWRRIDVADGFLQRVEREHRALQAGRADVDPEEVEEIVGAEAGDVLERLALDLVGQERRARLADRTAAAGEADPLDDAITDAEHHRDPVTAQGVGTFMARGGCLDDPEV